MLLSEYEAIIERHRSVRPLRLSIDVLIREFPHIPAHTLRSIISTDFTMMVRQNYYLYANPERIAQYYDKYKSQRALGNSSPGFLLKIADDLNLSASLICRFVLESHLRDTGEVCSKRTLNQLLKDTWKIHDEVLAVEIFLCTLHDPFYGPFSDAKRASVGQEFELILKDTLRSRKIAFIDENALRKQGYDKTPDVKLEVPAIINGEFVITWIESKASFGDPNSHKSYTHDQFHSYVNRFGPGLVIYWRGFVDELQLQDTNISEEMSDSPAGQRFGSLGSENDQRAAATRQFLLVDRLPDDIRSMTEIV
ncbi:hypothetical protein BIW11_09303 [Tropilaelaps mercedesae]|uniref:CDAN1-interacting nuclease 1 n=1 Tax=Tropilaelaps mercedesae TaxID=418985 RepID=A0A1V9XKW9_9ACAR|nr:hypothetical protein BIW11_09303 [Tropilaelaps mercedesae]